MNLKYAVTYVSYILSKEAKRNSYGDLIFQLMGQNCFINDFINDEVTPMFL